MLNQSYLDWVIRNTRTQWWHDSAEEAELAIGLERGAIGVTTNPYLANVALVKDRELWSPAIEAVLARKLPPEQQAEALMRIAVTTTAAKLMPQFEASQGQSGLVCGQVNPVRAGDRDAMLPMARRYHAWAPNIAVKLPATSAGLDVMEDCIAEGMAIAMTVSFTVPQAIAIGERHMAGIKQAQAKGIEPGKCFAVIMIGRTDDFMREVAHDTQAAATESDIRQAGLAVTKRAYRIQRKVIGNDLPREERIDQPIPAGAIERLCRMPEFVRAYEPDGMPPSEFIGFGATQRTLSQFIEAGWKLMENYR
jgi:transaldolase